MNELMLSIYVATYNHENYIGKALDGILMQKTEYPYEVLIGEDCSIDGTRRILKEYEEKYPGRFQIFYREHNMFHEEVNNGEDLKRRCRGKYIIGLEGDDYWTDPYKIDKQIRFLEEHPDYMAVAHNCVVVDEFSNPNGEEYQECKDEEYTIHHFASEIMPGQLTTVMYRNFYAYDVVDASICKRKLSPGDRCIYFTLVANGKVYCMQEIMSAYRHITNKGTSFSATYSYQYPKWKALTSAFLEYADKLNNAEAKKYAEFMYMRNVYMAVKYKALTLGEALREVKDLSHKMRAFIMCIIFIINKRVLKKDVQI